MDTGNLLFKTKRIAPNISQDTITATGIIDAYDHMGYDTVAVGPYDLSAGIEFLKVLKPSHFKWISANIVDKNYDPIFAPYVIKHIGEITIGIIGLTPMDVTVKPPSHIIDWRMSLNKYIPTLSKRCDIIIVLSHLSKAENLLITQKYPEIHILLTANQRHKNIAPYVQNSTLVSQSSTRGKNVGHLKISLGKGRKWMKTPMTQDGFVHPKETINNAYKEKLSFSYRFIAMESKFPENRKVKVIVKRIRKQIQFLKRNLQRRSIPTIRKTKQLILEKVSGFLRCQKCHEIQSTFWKTTRHYNAHATLLKKGQAFNLECLPCHTTHNLNIPEDSEKWNVLPFLPTPYLGVGCESCHGPGRAHAQSPETSQMSEAVNVESCLICHTKERDDHFQFNEKVKDIRCPSS
ncbi:MAG: hypothetical protein GY707_07495 [Desulfobacteraceae bacterium]|nr:hypothetical protein [Desulfobacteraceae bacterium]